MHHGKNVIDDYDCYSEEMMRIVLDHRSYYDDDERESRNRHRHR